MNLNKLANLLLLLTLPVPADATLSIFATIILFFTGFFNNICDTALGLFPSNLDCQCSAGLTSIIFGLVVTGAELEIKECRRIGNLGGNPNLFARCEGNFQAVGPLISVFSQDFDGTAFGSLDCEVISNDTVDRFSLTVRGNVDLSLIRPDLTLRACEGTIRKNGISAGECSCSVNDANGNVCSGGAEISFNCPSIRLARTCVDLNAIA